VDHHGHHSGAAVTAGRTVCTTLPTVRAPPRRRGHHVLTTHVGNERPSILLGWQKHFGDATAQFNSRHDTMVAILSGAWRKPWRVLSSSRRRATACESCSWKASFANTTGKAPLSDARLMTNSTACCRGHRPGEEAPGDEIRAKVEKNMPRPQVSEAHQEFFRWCRQ